MKPECANACIDPHLATDSTSPFEAFPWRRIRRVIDGYAFGITQLIGEAYGRQTVQQAWREFTIGRSEQFLGDDPNSELFFSWLFHRWAPGIAKGDRLADDTLYGVPPTRAYLERNSARLDPLLHRYLEACLSATFGFYEISECKPYLGFRARDVCGGAEFHISEDFASTTLRNGDVVFASFVRIDGVAMVEAVAPFSFRPPFQSDWFAPCTEQRPRGHGDLQLRQMYFGLLESNFLCASTGARTTSSEARH